MEKNGNFLIRNRNNLVQNLRDTENAELIFQLF